METIALGQTKTASATPPAHEPRSTPAIRADVHSRLHRRKHRARVLPLVGVDRRCAVLELQMFGVRLKKDYVAAVFETARVQEKRAIAARMERELAVDEENLEGSEFFRWSADEEDDEVAF